MSRVVLGIAEVAATLRMTPSEVASLMSAGVLGAIRPHGAPEPECEKRAEIVRRLDDLEERVSWVEACAAVGDGMVKEAIIDLRDLVACVEAAIGPPQDF